jgi:hypothetical protein
MVKFISIHDSCTRSATIMDKVTAERQDPIVNICGNFVIFGAYTSYYSAFAFFVSLPSNIHNLDCA